MWRDAAKFAEAADALKITADDLIKFNIIDGKILEPVGGAHTNHQEMGENMKKAILDSLNELSSLSKEELRNQRYDKFRHMGAFIEG